jgi:hypothetical protein
MRIEGPISARVKGLRQIFPHRHCEKRQRRDKATEDEMSEEVSRAPRAANPKPT